MGKYEDQKENLKKVAAHLEKAGIKYEWIDLSGSADKFPAIYTNYTYKGFTFDVLVINNNQWFSAKCLVLDTTDFDPELRSHIYELGLEFNFQLPETTFSVDTKQLFVESDMPIDVSYDDFMNVELNSIAIGIDAIVDKIGPDKAEIKSTKGKVKTDGTKRKD